MKRFFKRFPAPLFFVGVLGALLVIFGSTLSILAGNLKSALIILVVAAGFGGVSYGLQRYFRCIATGFESNDICVTLHYAGCAVPIPCADIVRIECTNYRPGRILYTFYTRDNSRYAVDRKQPLSPDILAHLPQAPLVKTAFDRELTKPIATALVSLAVTILLVLVLLLV